MDKQCRICGEVKPIEQFHHTTEMRDGHRSECIECKRRLDAERYASDPERRARAVERVKAWQAANPERTEQNRRRWAESGRQAASTRKAHLKRKYGITPEQYDERLARQGGGCALCGAPAPDGQSLHVDHEHATGRVRGLLCFNCNAGIGKFRDDPELLSRAAAYVGVHRRIAALIGR